MEKNLILKKTAVCFVLAFFALGFSSAGGTKEKDMANIKSEKESGSVEMNVAQYARILNVMAKVRRGEKVCVASFGGSITTGYNSEPKEENSWSSIVGRWWKKKGAEYGSDIRFMNEGVSGTDSAWGTARADVHLFKNNVDFVHLEFAMNDQWLEKQVRNRSYEGLIRQIMNGSDRAIMALFVNERNGVQSSQQGEQQPICEHYGIPFVSWKDCEKKEKGSSLDWNLYFDGEEAIHPNNAGHAEIGKFIVERLDEIWNLLPEDDTSLPAVDRNLPPPITDTGYEYVEFLASSDVEPESNTGWNKGSPVHPEWVSHGGARSGWSTMSEGAEMIFRVHGTSVNVLYSESDSFRNAQAWVENDDGSPAKKITIPCMNPIRQGYLGWGSRELVSCDEERDFVVHVICPKARATEQKKECNICGLLVTHLSPN